MTQMSSALEAMINGQLKPNEVNDPALLDAIRAVPREQFVPKSRRGFAYVDEAIEARDGRYLLAPMVFARMVKAADVRATDMVLDIAVGTGYSAAVLSHLAESVVALEDSDAAVAQIEDKLTALNIVNVAAVSGDLAVGAAKQAPFDVIFLEGRVQEVPAALFKQLADGGRLLAVVGAPGAVSQLVLYTKHGSVIGDQILMDASAPELPGFARGASFVF